MAQTVCFAPFFFLNFGLNKLFWPIRLESTRFSANQPKSEPLRHELAKKKKNHVTIDMSQWDAAGHAGSSVPRVSLRPAASDVLRAS